MVNRAENRAFLREFTEVVIAAGLTLIVLTGVMTAGKSMTDSAQVGELHSQVTSALDVAARRVEKIVRSGVQSTICFRSSADGVV